MNRWVRGTTFGALVLLFLPAISEAGPARKGAKETTWLSSYAVGKAEARRTGKPLLVAFR